MPIYGLRAEDSLLGPDGRPLSGVTVELYPTQADAIARTNLLAAPAVTLGRWESPDLADAEVWARTPGGEIVLMVYPTSQAYVDDAVTAVRGDLAAKADKATVDQSLATKADATAVTDALAGKADRTDFLGRLAGKADRSYVDTALADKASTSALAAAVAGLATTQALAGKADATSVNQALLAKATTGDVSAAEERARVAGAANAKAYTDAQDLAHAQAADPHPGYLIRKPAILANNVHLDSLTASGLYLRNTSTGTTAALGYPQDGWAGWVEVIAYSSTGVMQRATAISTANSGSPSARNQWVRTKWGTDWGSWTPVTMDLKGAGSPLNVVAAPVGTYYTDLAATNGAQRWYKASGTTGPSGWIVVQGDTGWRDITSLMHTDWLPATVAPTFRMRRVNDMVTVELRFSPAAAILATPRASARLVTANLPLGFGPGYYTGLGTAQFGNYPGVLTNINSRSRISYATSAIGNHTAGDNHSAGACYHTDDPWPTVLP